MARQICLNQLAVMPRTRSQLADALAKRLVPDDVAMTVLDRFSDVGLIDDRAFAQAWVRSRHHGRGLATRALRQELRHRGVDEDVVTDAVAGMDPETEQATARRLVQARLPRLAGVAPEVAARRLSGMLARKGYPAETVHTVVRSALAGQRAADTGEA